MSGLNGSLGLGVLLTAQDNATAVINGFGASLKHAAGLSKESIASIKSDLKEFALGMSVFGLGVSGLVALGPALDEANAFSRAIKLVATEVDAATFNQAAMKKETRALAGEFGLLPVEEAKALYKAVALGANDAAKSTALMTATNELAVAGDADLKVTMDALGGSINAYHLSAEDAAMVSDAFFTAMKNGNTTVGDLASSVGRVSAGAHVMGITIQEILGAVSVMTNKGIQASEAVAYLHGALANIEHPMKTARAEATRLGIDFSAAAVRSKGFVGFLHSITDNAKFNADSLGKLFHSVEGFQAMAMLAGDLKSVDAVMKEMANSAGATAKGFAIMAEGSDHQIKRYEALKHTTLGLIGEALQPLQARTYKFVNTVLEGFNRLSPSTQAYSVKGFALAATFAVILGGVVALKAGIALAAAAFSAAGVTMMGTLLPVAAALGVVTAAFYVFKVAYERDLGGFRAFVDDTVEKVTLAWAALQQVFSEGAFSGQVLKDLNKADNEGVKAFVIQVYVAANRIRHFFGEMADGFSDGLKRVEPTFDKFTDALHRLGVAFGIVSVDTDANGRAFDSYGAAGRSAGLQLANVADIAVRVATAVIDLTIAVKPLVGWILDLALAMAKSDTAITAAKIALIAYVAYAMAGAIVSTAQLGFAAANTAVRLAIMASSLNISGAAGAASAAIRGVVATSAAALGPIGALAAALTALYLAFDQWQKLQKELGEHGWSDLWGKLKNDLGIDSDAFYQRTHLGIVEGDDYDRLHGLGKYAKPVEPNMSPVALPMPQAGPLASVAAVEGQRASVDTSNQILGRVADVIEKDRVVQADVLVNVQVGDEELADVMTRTSVSRGVRGGIPMSSQE